MTTTSKRITTLAILAILTAAAMVLLLTRSDDTVANSSPVAEDLAAQKLAVFTAKTAPEDGAKIAETWSARLRKNLTGDLVRVRTTPAGTTYAMGGPSGALCLASTLTNGQASSAGCTSSSAPAAGKPLVNVTLLDSGYQITGVFADGVSTVKLASAKGALPSGEVIDNTLALQVADEPRSISWQQDGKELELKLGTVARER